MYLNSLLHVWCTCNIHILIVIGLYTSLIVKVYFILQVNLVEWLKVMVGTRRAEEVIDPNLETKPATRALKRALLIALRCVDPEADKRPKMTQVVRMLEADDYPSREVLSP